MLQLVLSLTVFWFLTVIITQDHRISFKDAFIWSLISIGVASIVIIILARFAILKDPLAILGIGALIQGVGLWYALRFRFYVTDSKQIVLILGSYFGVFIILGFVLG